MEAFLRCVHECKCKTIGNTCQVFLKIFYNLCTTYCKYSCIPYIWVMDGRKSNVINFKASDHLRDAIVKNAQKKGLTPSTFIREIIKKYIKYKEPDIL